MRNTQLDLMWGAVKWILGVIAAVGFYLASYTFTTFSNKLDKVYEVSTRSDIKITNLESEQREMRHDITELYGRTAQRFEQGRPNN